MPQPRRRVYCAGPLFNEPERREMAEIAQSLENAGFETFLPQRDGLEMATCIPELMSRGFTEGEAARILSRAIFALDVYQVIRGCDAVFVNLNGRVPDEGAVSEAALAWYSGKHAVGYKADSRSLLAGQDNPLVAGLFGFVLHRDMDEAVRCLVGAFAENPNRDDRFAQRTDQIAAYIELGHAIWESMGTPDPVGRLAALLASRERAGSLATA